MPINRQLEDMAGKSPGRDEEAALAGSILYNSFNNSQNHNSSVMMPPVEVIEDPHVTKCCRMSAVRRTFCLVVLFDLVLTFILWLLYTELALRESFMEEVENYDFRVSMFDIVWMACGRFFILILSYALFRSQKPWFVAVSTLLTCTYVIVKLFLYSWTDPSPTTPPSLVKWVTATETPAINSTVKYLLMILLVISSLVLAWVEVWLLDFKVLPLEQRAREGFTVNRPSERTPLLRDNRSNVYQSDNFYSPYESPTGSDDESETFKSARASRGHSRNISRSGIYTPEEQSYIKASSDCLERAWSLHKDEDGWKAESGDDVCLGIVSSRKVDKMGKVFRLVGFLDIPPKDVFEEIAYNFENQLSWNSTVLAAEIIQRIDQSTDVTYNIAAEAMGGMVSTRDFVNVRHWAERDGAYILAGVAAEHPSKPEFKEHIRGENKTGAWIAKPFNGNLMQTEFTWLMNVNLKGWLPQGLIDQALSGVMKDFLKALQSRCAQIKEERYGATQYS